MTVKEIQQDIVAYLEFAKVRYMVNEPGRVHFGGDCTNYRSSGWPDIICLLQPEGCLCGIVIKHPDRLLSDTETDRLKELVDAGWLMIVAGNADDVSARFQKYGAAGVMRLQNKREALV